MKKLKFDLSIEQIQALLSGKILQYEMQDLRVVIVPPNHGLFLTYKEIDRIKRAAMMGDFQEILHLFSTDPAMKRNEKQL